MLNRDAKKRLKGMIIDAIYGKLPISDGTFSMEAAQTTQEGAPFLNIKVKDGHGNLETYFEVFVKERY